MALVINDRVKETTETTGTGAIQLIAPVSSFDGFAAAIGDGNTTYYCIFRQASGEWETGLGTVTDAATDTLSRDTVYRSSNANAKVDFAAGTKLVINSIFGNM